MAYNNPYQQSIAPYGSSSKVPTPSPNVQPTPPGYAPGATQSTISNPGPGVSTSNNWGSILSGLQSALNSLNNYLTTYKTSAATVNTSSGSSSGGSSYSGGGSSYSGVGSSYSGGSPGVVQSAGGTPSVSNPNPITAMNLPLSFSQSTPSIAVSGLANELSYEQKKKYLNDIQKQITGQTSNTVKTRLPTTSTTLLANLSALTTNPNNNLNNNNFNNNSFNSNTQQPSFGNNNVFTVSWDKNTPTNSLIIGDNTSNTTKNSITGGGSLTQTLSQEVSQLEAQLKDLLNVKANLTETGTGAKTGTGIGGTQTTTIDPNKFYYIPSRGGWLKGNQALTVGLGAGDVVETTNIGVYPPGYSPNDENNSNDNYNKWINEFKAKADLMYQNYNTITGKLQDIDQIITNAMIGFRKTAEDIRNNPDLSVWQKGARLKELDDLQNYAPIFDGLSLKDLIAYRGQLADMLNHYADFYNKLTADFTDFAKLQRQKTNDELDSKLKLFQISTQVLGTLNKLGGETKTEWKEGADGKWHLITYQIVNGQPAQILSDQPVTSASISGDKKLPNQQQLEGYIKWFNQQVGTNPLQNGKVTDEDWNIIKADWITNGYDISKFESYFKQYKPSPNANNIPTFGSHS